MHGFLLWKILTISRFVSWVHIGVCRRVTLTRFSFRWGSNILVPKVGLNNKLYILTDFNIFILLFRDGNFFCETEPDPF